MQMLPCWIAKMQGCPSKGVNETDWQVPRHQRAGRDTCLQRQGAARGGSILGARVGGYRF